jgi:hypothetical protein
VDYDAIRGETMEVLTSLAEATERQRRHLSEPLSGKSG